MAWSREALLVLADEWEKHPCLYDTKNPLVYNKLARLRALETICNKVKILRPTCTASDVKTKLSTLRTQFVAEKNKVRHSRTSGCSPDMVYTPNWWLYPKLRFLSEHIQMRKTSLMFSGCDSPVSADSQYSTSMTADGQMESFDETCYDETSERSDMPDSPVDEKVGVTDLARSSESSFGAGEGVFSAHSRSRLLSGGPMNLPSSQSPSLKRRHAESSGHLASEFSAGAHLHASLQNFYARNEMLQNLARAANEPDDMDFHAKAMLTFLASAWSKIKSPRLKLELKHKWIQALMDVELRDLDTEDDQ